MGHQVEEAPQVAAAAAAHWVGGQRAPPWLPPDAPASPCPAATLAPWTPARATRVSGTRPAARWRRCPAGRPPRPGTRTCSCTSWLPRWVCKHAAAAQAATSRTACSLSYPCPMQPHQPFTHWLPAPNVLCRAPASLSKTRLLAPTCRRLCSSGCSSASQASSTGRQPCCRRATGAAGRGVWATLARRRPWQVPAGSGASASWSTRGPGLCRPSPQPWAAGARRAGPLAASPTALRCVRRAERVPECLGGWVGGDVAAAELVTGPDNNRS